MIRPWNKVHPVSTAPAGCRVITARMLHKLHDAVRGWATALAGDDQYRNPDLVRQQLAACKLQGRNAVEAYARPAIASSWAAFPGIIR